MTQTQTNCKIPIDFYLAQGFTLFPLRGKVPFAFGWAKLEYDPLLTPESFPYGNAGVKLGEDDLVIDIDPRNFLPGENPIEAFQAAIGIRLKMATFTVKTGGGGLHIYFKKPKDWQIKYHLKEFAGIDFRTSRRSEQTQRLRNQYIVSAGSVHPDTNKEYVILYDIPIQPAPRALLELLKQTETAPGIGISHYVNDKQTIDRYATYLRSASLGNGIYVVASVGHDFGLHPDKTLEMILQIYNPRWEDPCDPELAKQKVYHAYKYNISPVGNASPIDKFEPAPPIKATAADFRLDAKKEKPLRNVYNAVIAFNIDMPETLTFNEFSEDIEFLKPAPWHRPDEKVLNWTDEDTARCQYYFSKERLFDPPPAMIQSAIVTVAMQKTYHPIKKYLESLKWDGFARLATWVPKLMGTEDNDYTRSVGLKTLVAAVKRIYEPGCKFDYVPVFEGVQGLGKSRAMGILGGKWYGDMTIDVHARDTIDIMRRLWFIEVSEMETQYRTETQALRAFLSRGSDITRLAYARCSKDFPRHSIFVGTINPEFDTDLGWLKDTTGNRRFWPVYCKKVDIDQLILCRDQLWAEAYLYYKAHTAIHFDDHKIEALATVEQIKRMGKDPWLDTVALYFSENPNLEIVSGVQVYKEALNSNAERFNRQAQTRISMILRSLGWEKGVFYDPITRRSVNGYRKEIEQ